MGIETPEVKGRSNGRFGSIIFLLRVTGIPFKIKNVSTLYAIYMTTVILSTCATYVGMFFDVYMNRNDLGHVMTNIRVSMIFTNCMWAFIYCR
jgi:glucan phosphoethanolaminetransferase (alkaline phosphatase superfamily)